MLSFFIHNLMWTEGIFILLASIVAIVIGIFYSRLLLIASLFFLAFSLFFFRHPDRTPPIGNDLIISPSDGTVVAITQDNDHPQGLTQKVSIFLSPLDVHVNRAPFTGHIDDIIYTPGAFIVAFLPKSSLLNEHNDMYFCDKKGRRICVRQIAGFIARRICCWATKGQSINRGVPFGMIKFGSRVDLFMPSTVCLNIEVGQRVYAGETVVGTWI